MSVGGFLELYLSFYAWGFYNVLWDLFTHFGIIYIPFGMYLFEAYSDKSERGKGKQIAEATLYQLKIKIFLGMTVLLLAGVPILPITHSDYSYTNMYCDNSGARTPSQVNGGGSTGTTFDSAFGTTTGSPFLSSVKVPAWWWAILNISQAINDGFKVKIPCKISLSEIRYDIHKSKIDDPALKQELADFINSCYKPAVSKFSRENPATYTSAMVDKNDIGWIGSSFFLNTPGFYKTSGSIDGYRSEKEVAGFPYQTAGRDQGEHTPGNEPALGRPYCDEWYNNSTSGLRKKLVDNIGVTSWSDIGARISNLNPSLSTTEREDTILRTLVEVSTTPIKPSSGNSIEMLGSNQINTYGTLGSTANHVAATAGTAIADAIFYPTMYLIRQALPLVHAFLLFGLLFLIPFLLILSQYSIEKMLAYSALIMSVKFWPSLWELGRFFESNLEQAMTQDQGWISLATASTIDNVLGYVMGAWYVMSPAILSTVMAIAGFHLGKSLDSASNQGTQQSGQAGGKGGQMATSAASKSMTKGK